MFDGGNFFNNFNLLSHIKLHSFPRHEERGGKIAFVCVLFLAYKSGNQPSVSKAARSGEEEWKSF